MSFAALCSKAVVRKAQEGDKFAICQIYNTYKVAIYSLAYQMLKDKHSAEDILQTVVEKMILKLGKLSEPNKLGSWLKRMTYNTVIDHFRKHSKEVFLDEPLIEHLEFEQVTKTLADELFDLEAYLSSLKPLERLVVSLHAIEGYGHAEVASKLDISESNSKQLYRRSLKKLESIAALERNSGNKQEISNG